MANLLAFSADLNSTHDLLFRLLASETGLMAASHPLAQLNAVTASYSALKALSLSNLGKPEGAAKVRVFGPLEAQDVAVDAKKDASLFAGLYRGLAPFLASEHEHDEVLQARVVSQFLRPTAARAVFEDRALGEAVGRQLRAHHEQHGDAVARRNLAALKHTFRVPPAVLAALTQEIPGRAQD